MVVRRSIVFVVLLALALSGCDSGQPDQRADGPAVRSTQPPGSGPSAEGRSSPRWETLTTFSGTGSFDTPEFDVAPGAIQWRIRWSCEIGNVVITTTPPPRRLGPVVEAGCPGNGEAFSIHTGRVRFSVQSSGPWKAVVDQQVDTPLDEPLPPEVASSPVIAQGSFYRVERDGKGTARIHRLTDGRRVLRLEGFEVSHNTDLFVWLSEARQPTTSAEAVKAGKVVIGNLKSTLGNQNYEIPASVPTTRIRSIVIWCEPVAIAYTAAALS
jgi:hypothetical protein